VKTALTQIVTTQPNLIIRRTEDLSLTSTVKITTMPLCKACQKIDIRVLVTSRTQLPDDLWKTHRFMGMREKLEIYQPQAQMLHSSVLQAREKSTECELCALVWKEWLNTARLSAMYRNKGLSSSDENVTRYFLREFDDHEMWIQVLDTRNGTYLCVSCGRPGNIYLSVEFEIYIPTEGNSFTSTPTPAIMFPNPRNRYSYLRLWELGLYGTSSSAEQGDLSLS
jgi:hypothetical protein